MFKGIINTIILFSSVFIFASCGGMVGDSKKSAGGDNPANSNSKTLTAFSIITPSSAGVIDETSKTVSITVPHGTDMSNLVADFSTTGEATTVNGVEQVNRITANNFTNPVIYTITAENGTSADYTVNVTAAQSSAKAITSFSINGVNASINESAKTIGLTLPNGTDLTSLTAVFTTTGASVKVGSTVQVSGSTVNNFSANVIYTVTAADGSQQNYTAAVSAAPSGAKAITAFSINGVNGTINESTKTIGLTLPYGTDVTALTAFFTTTGISVETGFFGTEQISGVTANDFTDPVTYTVTAEDGSEAEYTVAVSVAAGNAKAFTAFSIGGINGTINEPAKTIVLTMPFGTDISALVASFSITGSSVKIGSTVQASGGTANSFSGDVIYTVVAGDGSEQNYTVSVSVALNSARAFSAFSINSVNGTINETLKTIALTVPSSTNLTALAAVFTVTGASVKVGDVVQVSGTTPNNFTSPVVYTVTAENGSTQNYTVTVTRTPSSAKGIMVFYIVVEGTYYKGAISQITGNIEVVLPGDTDLTALAAFFFSTGASVMVGDVVQVEDVTQNDFTDEVVYTVYAEDGTTKDYTVVCVLSDMENHWAKNIICNTVYGMSEFYDVQADSSGNIYAAGRVGGIDGYGNGTAEFSLESADGNLTVNSEDYDDSNVILVKYNHLGQAQWAKTVTGGSNNSKFNSVSIDSSGNIYAAGYITGTETFNFGDGVTAKGTYSDRNIVLVKYNASGTALWAKTVFSGTSFSEFTSVTVDINGNIYTAGRVAGTGLVDYGDGQQITGFSNSSILLVKYSSTGQTQWAKTFVSRPSSGDAYYHSLTVDAEGNVYAAGEGSGSYNFGNNITANSTGALLVKYDTNGIAQWASSSISEYVLNEGGHWVLLYGPARYYSVGIDSSGNIYTVGYLKQGVSFGNNVYIWGSSSYKQSVIVKYNSSGVAQWARSVSSAPDYSEFNSISVDNTGNIYTAGYIFGSSVHDFGNGVTAKGVDADGWNSVLVKYNTSGETQWAKTAVSGPGDSYFNSVSVDNNSHIYTVGFIQGSGTFNFGDYATVSSGSQRCVIVKYLDE